MGARLDNAKALYVEAINDGDYVAAINKYAGDRYTQHSTPVKDGKEGFIEFFADFVERNPERDIEIAFDETRRNILTRGLALNHLVGREFTVGTARIRGIKLCEPCGHLENLTRGGVRRALVHRGGLRAEVIGDGVIKVGDRLEA